METPQSYMARLEGGAANPTMKARKRFAEAVGSRVKITFEPESSQPYTAPLVSAEGWRERFQEKRFRRTTKIASSE